MQPKTDLQKFEMYQQFFISEMYDPEEACNDENSAVIVISDGVSVKSEIENEQDDKWAEIDTSLKQEASEVKDIKVEAETKPSVASPRGRRAGQAKNGAGPKSKRGRK